MDTILEAFKQLREDFEIEPLTDEEKEEWKARKELLGKLSEIEVGTKLEVTEDILNIFQKALREMEETGMPVGKVPNMKITPLEDAVPTVGEDDELEDKEEITESNETKYLLGFSHNSLSGGKAPFVMFDDIKNYQESEEDGVKTFSFEDKDTKYKYVGNDETGYKEVDNRGPQMDSYRIVGRRTVKRNYPSTLDKSNRIGYKPITNPTWESLNEDLIIVDADKVKDKLYALKDEIEKAEGNLKFFLKDLFEVYMYHAFWGGVPTSSEESNELEAKGIAANELIHSDLTKKEWDELAEWSKGIKVEFKK